MSAHPRTMAWGVLFVAASFALWCLEPPGRRAAQAEERVGASASGEATLAASHEAANEVRMLPRSDTPVPEPTSGEDSARESAAPLAVHQRLEVWVGDELGRPVAGAAVHCDEALGGSGSSSVDLVTGADGRVSILPGAGRLRLVASKDGRSSPPWERGAAPADLVRLFLAASFDARGSVLGEWIPAAGIRVGVEVATDALETELAVAHVGPSGGWTIDGLPVLDGGRYVFRLSGAGSSETERTVVAPAPGSQIVVDFAWRPGVSNRVLVQTADGDPIAGARVRLLWEDETGVHSIDEASDELGMASFVAAPEGEVWFQGEAQGFAAQRSLPQRSPLPGTLDLVLQPGSRVRGRCTYEGEALTEFSVHYFGDEPERALREDFRARPDGSFVLENAPAGELTLFASTRSLPMGRTVTILAEPGTTSEVELELVPAGEAFGQVVDAETGQPLPGATAQVFLSHADHAIEPWGPAVPADWRGNVHGLSVSRVANRVEIGAPGYGIERVTRVPDPGGRLDLGIIGLSKEHSLTVRLDGPAGSDCSQYWVEAEGSTNVPRLQFPPDGRVRFPHVNPGAVVFSVYPPGARSRIDLFVVAPLPGDPELVVPMSAARSLAVRMVSPDGSPLPRGAILGATCLSPQGHRIQHGVLFDEDHVATVESLATEEVVVDVYLPGGERFAVERIRCPAGEETYVEIPIATQERLVRFLSPSLEPISGAPVRFTLPDDPTSWLMVDLTDAEGLCRLRGVAGGEILATVDVEGRQTAYFLPVPLTGDANEVVEVVVDASAAFGVRLVEREEPIARAHVGQYSADGRTMLARSESDESGLAIVYGVSAGEYRARLVSEGFWPAEMQVQARADDPRYTLQVRRLGSLEVHVARAGVDLAGVEVELVSIELQATLSDWIARAAVTVPGGKPVTDLHGRLRLDGLPNGTYRWRTRSVDGAVLEGEVSVPPHDTTLLPVVYGS